MRLHTPLLALATAAACGGAAASDRVSVMALDRLSGELSGQEVDLAGTDLSAVRGPAALFVLSGGISPACELRRKVTGALVARTLPCVALLGEYAAMDRGRQFLLAAGAEAMAPAPVLADSSRPGLHYVESTDSFTVGDGPQGARVPGAFNPGAVTRELARRQL